MADNGWNEWQNFVLKEIKCQKDSLKQLESTLINIQVDIGRLKLQAGIWGLIGGAIPIAIAVIVGLVAGKF